MTSKPSASRISIHALREEGDAQTINELYHDFAISIHALREEGDMFNRSCIVRSSPISIHALREEGDPSFFCAFLHGLDFYPRPPRGGRRLSGCRCSGTCNFYPRPPRGGRLLHTARQTLQTNFYPRPPRGGRPAQPLPLQSVFQFLSTPSARRATDIFADSTPVCRISIHALREEGDAPGLVHAIVEDDFYPRPPRGGRQTAI